MDPAYLPSAQRYYPSKRQAEILRMVGTASGIRVDEVAQALDVSVATVYRDAAQLEQNRLLVRDKGELRGFVTSTNEPPLQVRGLQSAPQKQAIAKTAARFVSAGDAVMLDDSSTAVPLLHQLEDVPSLTVITNSLLVADSVKRWKDAELVLIGGRYYSWADAFYGPLATSLVENIRADICFMSDAALWGNSVYNPIDYVIDMKRAMLKNSARKILLVDNSKFSRTAWQKTASLSTFDAIVTDSGVDQEALSNLEQSGLHVLVADA